MILPIKESVIFDERFHGMEIYCPVDEDSNMFHRIKIIDHTRYLINGQETMVYDDNIDSFLFKNLDRFAHHKFIFNSEYYKVGERYVNSITYETAILKSYSPTTLIFDSEQTSVTSELYTRQLDRNFGSRSQINIWLSLGENCINEFIIDKPVISERKLLERIDEPYGEPAILLYNKKEKTVIHPHRISGARNVINDREIQVDELADEFRIYRISKTRNGLNMKEIDISDLYAGTRSIDMNDELINEGSAIVVVKKKGDHLYYASRQYTAEGVTTRKIERNKYHVLCEGTVYFNITIEEMTEFYVINHGELLKEIMPVFEEDYARRELISELVMREKCKSDEKEENK